MDVKQFCEKKEGWYRLFVFPPTTDFYDYEIIYFGMTRPRANFIVSSLMTKETSLGVIVILKARKAQKKLSVDRRPSLFQEEFPFI